MKEVLRGKIKKEVIIREHWLEFDIEEDEGFFQHKGMMRLILDKQATLNLTHKATGLKRKGGKITGNDLKGRKISIQIE